MIHLVLFYASFLVLFPFNLGSNINNDRSIESEKKILASKIETIRPTSTPTPSLTPTPTVIPIATPIIIPTSTPSPTIFVDNDDIDNDFSQEKENRISNHNDSIRISSDGQKVSSMEIFNSFNNYRSAHGVSPLIWDGKLGRFAQERADLFNRDQKLDNHAGFNAVFSDPSNIRSYGFISVGENSAIGNLLNAVHLIESVYGGHEPHDKNQLNSKWTHVGVGVSGAATDLVFGGK